MPTLTSDQFALDLRATNFRLCSWLDSVTLDGPPIDSQAVDDSTAGQSHTIRAMRAPTPEQMAGVLSELMRVGARLRELPRENDPELERELADYRKNVERVRAILPAIHRALVAERARLERERTRVNSAAQWARCSRETL